MGYGVVSIGTKNATEILKANPARIGLIIINGGSDVLHYGDNASVTSANSPYLLPDGSIQEDNGGTKMYCGAFYGIATSTSCSVYYWERER